MRYDVSVDYGSNSEKDSSTSPSWCLAIFRLGRPITYSRKEKKSIGPVLHSGMLRKEKPLIVTDDCMHVSVSGTKGAASKTLNVSLKGNVNYLSADNVLNGDWIMAWMHKTQQG
jgi:hypothetical protein